MVLKLSTLIAFIGTKLNTCSINSLFLMLVSWQRYHGTINSRAGIITIYTWLLPYLMHFCPFIFHSSVRFSSSSYHTSYLKFYEFNFLFLGILSFIDTSYFTRKISKLMAIKIMF